MFFVIASQCGETVTQNSGPPKATKSVQFAGGIPPEVSFCYDGLYDAVTFKLKLGGNVLLTIGPVGTEITSRPQSGCEKAIRIPQQLQGSTDIIKVTAEAPEGFSSLVSLPVWIPLWMLPVTL